MSETGTTTAPMRERVAEEVRALLGRRHMSGMELGRRINRTQSYMSRRLNGERAFDLGEIEAIADVLGVDGADLLPAFAEIRETVDRLKVLADALGVPVADLLPSRARVTGRYPPAHRRRAAARRARRRDPVNRPRDRRPIGRPDASTHPDGSRRTSLLVRPMR